MIVWKRVGCFSILTALLLVPIVTTQTCDSNAVCVKTDSGFSCTCNSGYEGSTTGCVNVDECTTLPCASGENCTDTDGSYFCHCGNINSTCDSYALCIDFQTCQCISGYTGDGVSCADIDECATSGACHLNATCRNAPGSFNCTCDGGYAGNGTYCTDIDECLTGQDNCVSPHTCSNTDGGFICQCGGDATCDANAQCVASANTSACVCNVGFTGSGSTCQDINECSSTSACHSNANCENTMGSFTCTCLSSYTGDGNTCTDVDECSTNLDDCVAPLTCNNTDGGFDCTCGSDASCHTNAQCVASGGTSNCICNDGYTGSGASCSDIDECSSSNVCDVNANCANTDGSYTCTCKEGYSGDGSECSSGSSVATISWTLMCMAIARLLISL